MVLGEREKIRKSQGVRVTENIWLDIEEAWSLEWTDTERYLDKDLGELDRIFESGKGQREPKERVGNLRKGRGCRGLAMAREAGELPKQFRCPGAQSCSRDLSPR